MEKMRKQAFMDWQAKFNGAENAGRLAEALNQLYT
jgi:hypothetical protein